MNLNREDYLEPACPLCGQPGELEGGRPVPLDRILEKLRLLEDRNDWPAVERCLKYWLAEAEVFRDQRGQLTLHNELMGYYRKQGKKEDAYSHADRADALLAELGMEDTVTAGTTWVNIGTVREAFGDPETGLSFFEKARQNYEQNLSPEDGRLGGLYNNMGLALASLGRYPESHTMFRRALDIMSRQPDGELEQAITWLNMADALEAELGPEAAADSIPEYIGNAADLLRTERLPRDGYYAFVCEKCAPVFGHHGFFLEEAEFRRRAKEINEGTGAGQKIL